MMSLRGLRLPALALAACLAAATGAPACGGDDDVAADPCAGEPVERFKELLVVDEPVINDARARNASAGAWSFRYLIENLIPDGYDQSEYLLNWLNHWVTTKELNGFRLDTQNEERVEGMNRFVVCPWLKSTPSNVCDSTCASCRERYLDLSKAPFRLTAITNRMDERELFPETPNGEGRLIYSLTSGPADDASSTPLAFALVFEYALPETRTLKDWADAWHALGKFSDYGEAYRAALQEITDAFVKKGMRPGGVRNSALVRIRTNESLLNWIWQLRQFEVGPGGDLELRPLFNTPAEQLNGSSTLAEFVRVNADAVREQRHVIPPSMRPGSIDALRFSWELRGVDETTTRAFTESTCNGCHSTSTVVDTAFHLSPFRTGRDKVSRFIHDPSGGKDELTLRTASYRRALCGK